MIFATWRDVFNVAVYVAAGIGAIITGLTIAHVKVVSPFIARPLARQLKKELHDEVIAILHSQEVSDYLQEVVALESSAVLVYVQDIDKKLGNMQRRMTLLENKQDQIVNATVHRPKNQRRGDHGR